MIESLHQVMLYVDNQDACVKFWTDMMGFVIKEEQELPEGFKSIEIAVNNNAQTTVVLFDKEFIRKYSPEVNLATPSMMFKTENIDELYGHMQSNGITVGELVEMPMGPVFNFADPDGNYFAVMERN